MKTAETVTAAILVVLGIITIFVLIPGQISKGDTVGLHPAVFPTLLMAIVTVLAGALLLKNLKSGRVAARIVATTLNLRQLLYAVAFCTFLFVFLAIMGRVGFIPAGVILIATLMYYLGARNPWKIAANSLLTPIIIFIVFKYIFGVPMP